MITTRILTLLAFISLATARDQCGHRDFGNGATVCVCNATYCDNLDPIVKTSAGTIKLYESSKSGDRFKETDLKFGFTHTEAAPTKKQTITLDRTVKQQKIIGFGGAFTDSAGINIKTLPDKLQASLIRDYFGDQGIEYTIGRIPIAGCDFSTHAYTYADNVPNDDNLEHFNLTIEDFDYKIPYLKQAIKASPHRLKYFGSAWGAPAWLKSNNKINDGSPLIGSPGGKPYKIFAHYLVKFIDHYIANGVPIWGLTVLNEPRVHRWNSIDVTLEQERDFIKFDLGPTLEQHGYGVNTTDLMILDDHRSEVWHWSDGILSDKEAAKYVSGVAFHWYDNNATNLLDLDKTRAAYPNHYLLATEACEEWKTNATHVSLGNWATVERYAYDIITDLNHFAAGWVDWNLALDTDGGPNWTNNLVDAPIIINTTAHEYYKQPFFYALGHFSKFLLPDSVNIGLTASGAVDRFLTTAFVRPDNGVVVIVLNENDDSVELNIRTAEGNVSTIVKPRSMQSYIYWV